MVVYWMKDLLLAGRYYPKLSRADMLHKKQVWSFVGGTQTQATQSNARTPTERDGSNTQTQNT